MSDCPAEEQLERYLAGAAASTLAAHVEGCPACQAWIAEAQADQAMAQEVRRALADPAAQHTEDHDAHAAQAPLSQQIPGYELIRELHRGGQGVVYQAMQQATKRKVAIKVLLEGPYASKSARRRFEREIELVAQLKHPNIISIFHSGTTADGRQFCVMAYVRGVPLTDYVRQHKPPLEDSLKLFNKVCEAVNYAHQKGVIHRDLKPSNILVNVEGDPRVLDFGLAKQTTEPLETLVSVSGQVVGTLPYASPEQTRGNPDEIDIRTDVYSLGVVLYEMLTGQYPYPVIGQMADVMRHIAETAPTPLTRSWTRDSGVTQRGAKRTRAGQCPIDDELQTIVLKTLSKERDRRYQSAGELARDIAHYLAGEPIEARADSIIYVVRKQIQRYRGAVFAATAFVVLIIAFGIVMLMQARNHSRLARAEARQRAISETVLDFLTNDLIKAAMPQAGGYDIKVREVLDAASEELQDGFKEEPLVEAAVHSAVGITYRSLGEQASATRHLKDALAIHRQELGATDERTLRCMIDLAWSYRLHKHYEAAEQLCVQASNAARQTLGTAHEDTLDYINHLGVVRFLRKDFVQAEAHYREVLRVGGPALGREHEVVLKARHNLGHLYHNQKRYDEAAPLYIECLEALRRRYGSQHPNTLTVMGNLAWIHFHRGNLAEAERLYQENLNARRAIQGTNHPKTLMCMANYGELLYKAGEYERARQMLEECDQRQQNLEQTPDGTPMVLALLAMTHQQTGRQQKAQAMMARLHQLIVQPCWTTDEDAQQFYQDAKELLGE